MIVRFPDGRASGDALVLFDNDRDLERALEKNRHTMGPRYVELFRSSLKEFQMVSARFALRNLRSARVSIIRTYVRTACATFERACYLQIKRAAVHVESRTSLLWSSSIISRYLCVIWQPEQVCTAFPTNVPPIVHMSLGWFLMCVSLDTNS